MKKYFLILLSFPLYGLHDTAWPHAVCGTCYDTCSPEVVRHYETTRRRYAKLPREPYQRCCPSR